MRKGFTSHPSESVSHPIPVAFEKKLLTLQDLSAYLSKPVGSLYQMVSQRAIPFVKVGRLTRFDPEEIGRWIKKNSHEPEIT